ncbi:MAG TPA: 3D domain-containing protein [Kofleriaceae bacterium]|nr:3D domain-containing protein [Kofleriaceae bacterium]
MIAGVALGAAAGAGLAMARNQRTQRFDLAATIRALATVSPRPTWDGPRPSTGDKMGSFKLTYYWMPTESGGPRKVRLQDRKTCRTIARVSKKFSRRLRLEGGGKLRDGRVLIYAGRCRCGSSPCYTVAKRSHKWGTGVNERPLSPFRSVAVDPSRVAIGTVLYVPELDGLTMPGSEPWGGFVHDGCVVADDRGGGIRGRQLDLFAARESHYRALDRRHRIKRVSVFAGGERCQSLSRRPASRRGSI